MVWVSLFLKGISAEDLYKVFPVVFVSDLYDVKELVVDEENVGDVREWTVSNNRDINGDNNIDLLIAAHGMKAGKGQIYVIFGNENAWSNVIKAVDFNGKNGFILEGVCECDNYLHSQAYEIYGDNKNWPTKFNFSNTNGTEGFAIEDMHPANFSGALVRIIDINQDGLNDIVISAHNNTDIDHSYVVFGCCRNISQKNFMLLRLMLGIGGGLFLLAQAGVQIHDACFYHKLVNYYQAQEALKVT